MTTAIFMFPVLAIIAALFVGSRTMKKTGNAGRSVRKHFVTVIVCSFLFIIFTFVASAAGESGSAAEIDYVSRAAATASASGMGFIGAGLSVGLSAIGAGIALAAGAPAAIGALSEDPKSFGKAMIFVVLGEAVALYGFVVAMLIILKIPTFAAL